MSGDGDEQRPTPAPAASDEPASVQPPSDEHAVPPEELPAYQVKRPKGPPAIGVLLVAIGGAWLLASLDLVEVDGADYLAVALGAIGLTLVLSIRAHARVGLVIVGLVLAMVVASGDAVGVGEGDWGTAKPAPASVDEIEDEYLHGTGTLELDLSRLDEGELEDATDGGDDPIEIDVELGIGNVEVLTPEGVDVAVDATAGIGNVSVGRGDDERTASSPLGANVESIVPGGGDEPLIELDVRVGIGNAEVEGP